MNPIFENTLKNNAESWYCRGYIYENAAYLYVQEMDILFSEVKKALETDGEIDVDAVVEKTRQNRERYHRIPLADMKPRVLQKPEDLLPVAADIIEAINFEV